VNTAERYLEDHDIPSSASRVGAILRAEIENGGPMNTTDLCRALAVSHFGGWVSYADMAKKIEATKRGKVYRRFALELGITVRVLAEEKGSE
jgi:hypothetical protein